MTTPTPGAASELLRDAMELLGAIGVGKAGEHALHNACNLRNRIDAYLQHTQIERLLGDSAPPALARPLDVDHTHGAASEFLIDEDNCPHEWERQNGAYGTDPSYMCICCGKVRTAESEADEQWL